MALVSALSPLTTNSFASLPTPIPGPNCPCFKLEDDLKDSHSESERRFEPLLNDLGPARHPRLCSFRHFTAENYGCPASSVELQTHPLTSSSGCYGCADA